MTWHRSTLAHLSASRTFVLLEQVSRSSKQLKPARTGLKSNKSFAPFSTSALALRTHTHRVSPSN
ncbi:hypothetical protein V8E36_001924 [Tilletia maclaganii]